MMASPLTTAVDTHKALAHPARLRILAMLRGGELCVCQLIAVLQLAPSTVSAHLSELKRAGLVEERKQGRWVQYRLTDRQEEKAILDSVLSAVARDSQLRADFKLLVALRKVPLVRLCRVDYDLSKVGIRAAVVTGLAATAKEPTP